jgi:hypothetical protein
MLTINKPIGYILLLEYIKPAEGRASHEYEMFVQGNPFVRRVQISPRENFYYTTNLLALPPALVVSPLILYRKVGKDMEIYPDGHLATPQLDQEIAKYLQKLAKLHLLFSGAVRVALTNSPVTREAMPITVYNLFGYDLPVYGAAPLPSS